MNDMQLLEQLAATDRYPDSVGLPTALRADVVVPIIARRMEMDTIERPDVEATKLHGRRRTRPAFAVAAFVVVVIVVATALLLTNRDDTIEPAESTTTTAAATTTTVAAVDTEALAAFGERLLGAIDARDLETVADLIADDADPVVMFGTATKSDLLALFGWIEATGTRFESAQCEGREPNLAECTVMQSVDWSAAGGASPQSATVFLKIEGDQVIALRYGRPSGLGSYAQRFRDFVFDADPTAPERMWYDDDRGEPYPLLTDEAFELFEQYTAEFVETLGGRVP